MDSWYSKDSGDKRCNENLSFLYAKRRNNEIKQRILQNTVYKVSDKYCYNGLGEVVEKRFKFGYIEFSF